MAVDYKGLRNLLDSSSNQTAFAQKLAQEFLIPLFSKTPAEPDPTQPTETEPTPEPGTGASRSTEKTPEQLVAEQYGDMQNSAELVYTGRTVKGPKMLSGYGEYGGLTINPNYTALGGKNQVGGIGTIFEIKSQGMFQTSDPRKTKMLEFQAWTKPEFEMVAASQYYANNYDKWLEEARNQLEKEKQYSRSSGSSSSDQIEMPDLPGLSELPNTSLKVNLSRPLDREADFAALEKYVSPTAARGLRALYQQLASGNIDADLRKRMESSDFNIADEAMKLIVQNPKNFAGVASYGGITSGFKAADLMDSAKLDTKKVLQAVSNPKRFRETLAKEVAKVTQSTEGARKRGQQFMLDARFDQNAESQIVANLASDIAKVGRQAGKAGYGASAYASQIYSAAQRATGYTGVLQSVAAAGGETLRGYSNRLAREFEKRTPKSLLESTSPYLRTSGSSVSTRTLANNFLKTSTRIGL